MKRTNRDTRTDVDLTKPVNIDDLILTDDCFGKLYDAACNECRICADSDLCAIVFDKTELSKIRKQVEAEHGPFADTYNFDAVRDSGLVERLKDNPFKYTREEVYDAVESLSGCDNPDLINDFIESMLIENGLKMENGYVG